MTGYIEVRSGETKLVFDVTEFEGMTLAEAEEEALQRARDLDGRRTANNDQ